MATLSKRERVMRTVHFEETDRIPYYDNLLNDAVIEHYAQHPLTVDNAKQVVSKAVGRIIDMTGIPYGPFKPGRFTDESGLVIQQERWTSWIVERPFDDVPSLKVWLERQIPRIEAQQWGQQDADALHQSIREYQHAFTAGNPDGRDDPAVIVPSSRVGLTPMFWATGLELLSYLLADEPGMVEAWLEAWGRSQCQRVAAIANPELIPVALVFDDIAQKTGTLFSPKWLRRIWLPHLRALIKAWHDHDTLVLFYSDGNLWKILDDLVDAGIDGLTPLEVQAGMSVKAVREKYPHLFVAGGIDVSHLLPYGTSEEVRTTCLQTIQDTGGRGYFMGSSVEMHQQVPLENARAMYECQDSDERCGIMA